MKNIDELIERVEEAERALREKHGPFTLFAMVLRRGASGLWDVVVASPWLEEDLEESRRELTGEIQQRLGDERILQLSRVVFVRPDGKAAEAFDLASRSDRPLRAFNHSGAFGFEAEDLHIIAANYTADQAAEQAGTDPVAA